MFINIIKSQKGMALVTVILMTLTGIVLVSGIYMVMRNATRTSGIESMYTQQIELARGISESIRVAIISDIVDRSEGIRCCNTKASCSPNFVKCGKDKYVDLSHFINAIPSTFGYTSDHIFANFLYFQSGKKAAVHIFQVNVTDPRTGRIYSVTDRVNTVVDRTKF